MLEGEFIERRVWRVGFRPEPWAWSDWSWAEHGRFQGRWDDPDGEFRTMYAGATLQACLAEILAGLRPSIETSAELAEIQEDPLDAAMYPTCPAETVSYSWLEPRIASRATLSGHFCVITSMASIAALRPVFKQMAAGQGFDDFDAATLKDQKARPITQAVSKFVWGLGDFNGISFNSRLGDDNTLWAIYERPDEPNHVSPQLSHLETHSLTPEDPAIVEIFALFNLRCGE
ncbi:RES family NAD+ phosphorylase [Arthrobacter sp. 2MCAF14]|uniref:RES family NAD+ phosphorylase n=1 Tax=Arthrobacter sp. 2MCAF14 TaxID=3232982 RepID=UPI003F8E2840